MRGDGIEPTSLDGQCALLGRTSITTLSQGGWTSGTVSAWTAASSALAFSAARVDKSFKTEV